MILTQRIIGYQLRKSSSSFRIALVIDESGLKVLDLDKSAFNPSDYPASDVAIFDLRATIAEIKLQKGPGHLLSHVNGIFWFTPSFRGYRETFMVSIQRLFCLSSL